jgi:RNA polymerase sigma factor (sigma-70 family)
MSPRISIRLLSAQSDQRLLVLAAEGHERAFEALVHRYRRPLLRYCRGMGLSEARAEDVLQQALLQAWLALARGTDVRDLKPWLYRIVHNTAVNAMRAAAESHGELTEAIHARAAVAGESDLERKLAMREALTDVAALPRMQRQAIFLTAVDGQSHDEVASALGISQGALRGLLYRARVTLRSAAAALMPPPLIEWASRGSGATGPTAERIAELTAGGGAAGMSGLLLKGAVLAVTAGAVASGAAVVDHREHARHAAGRAATARAGEPSQSAGPTVPGAFLASTPPLHARGGEDSEGARHGQGVRGRGHRGAGNGRHSGSEHPRDDEAVHASGDDQAPRSDAGERHGGQSVRGDREADVADTKGDGTSGDTSGRRGSGDSGKATSGKGSGDASGSADSARDGGSGGSTDPGSGGSEGPGGLARLSSGSTSGGSATDGGSEQGGGAASAEQTTSGKGGKGSGSDG